MARMAQLQKSAHFFVILLFFPTITFAATARTFGELADLALAIIGQATLVLMAAAIAIYFGHIAVNIFKSNKGEAGNQRTTFLWGILIIFVMVSLWGIIQVLQNTLFNSSGGGGSSPGAGGCVNFGDPGCGE